MSMDDVLNGNADELLDQMAAEAQLNQTTQTDENTQPDDHQDSTGGQQPTGEGTQGKAKEAEAPADKDAPPASEDTPHVPRKALEDERRKRQQLEQELAQMRQTQQHPQHQQAPQEQHQLPPEVFLQQQIVNERLNMSEMIVRQQHDDVDTVIERFQQEAQNNPALGAQLQSQTHPWKWAYDYAKRLMLMDEIGSDPEAYKQRLREQLMAELQQQQQEQSPTPAAVNPPAEKPNIPQSLATARSAAARSAPNWTGPTPLADIIK